MEQIETGFQTPLGIYTLRRYPQRKKETLRAWDAADEYLLNYLDEKHLLQSGISVLIVNDSFGALSVPLHQYQPVVMTDSYLSMQGMLQNSGLNHIDDEFLTLINALQKPEDYLSETADLVLIKIPKSLALLEHQLHQIRSALTRQTHIIAAGMTKMIHPSTLYLFESILGTTITSLARKKARLIFTCFDEKKTVSPSPYPETWYLDNGIELVSHAGVFSRAKLDPGTRLMLENLPTGEHFDTVIDLGCGNGVIGITVTMNNRIEKTVFIDESVMAIESAAENAHAHFSESQQAEFLLTDCLTGVEKNSVERVLCNPPFHINRAMNDEVAWQMFKQSRDVLKDKGELWVIGNRHLAYHAKLKHLFGNCDVIASNKKFTLLRSVRKQ